MKEHLHDITFTIQLNFRYKFLRTNRIEVTTRTDESFQLVKSETTNTWKVNKEISEQLFDKLKEDFERIKNLIDQQPKQYECVLNQTLPEELVPYLRNIQHIHVVLTGGRTEPVWLTDHKKVVVDYWGDFDMRKRYQLELEVPVILSYRDDTVVATFPVTPGQSLKPVEKAMEQLKNRFQYRTSIKGELTECHVKDLLTRAIAAQHNVIRRVIFGLEKGATCFAEQGVEYELRVSDDRVYYERDRHIQWVFVKDGNDFSIDLEYSDLFNVNITVYATAYQTELDTIRSTMTSKQLFALNDPHCDLVCFNNHRYYIKSRRSSGYFALVSVENLKNEERTYKKLTLLAHTNAYLTNHYVNA